MMNENKTKKKLINESTTLRDCTQKTRHESESNLRALINASTDAILLLDKNLKIIEMNEAAARIVGRPLNELLGKSVSDTMPPELFKSRKIMIKNVFNSGNPIRMEDEQFGAWYDQMVYPVLGPSGDVLNVAVIARDITERKHEEKLQAAQLQLIEYATCHTMIELLRKFLDEAELLTSSKIGFYHFIEDDQKTILLQTWSTNTLKHMCKAEGEGQHYPISEAGVWVDCVYERRPVIHNDYASLPHKKGLPKGHAPITRELVVPVFREDKIVAILGVGNKETDYIERDVKTVQRLADLAWETIVRKRAEEALRESEARLLEAQSIAHVGSWELDLINDELSWSDEVYRIFGLKPEKFEATLEAFLNTIHPEDRDEVSKAYSDSVEKKEPYEIIHRILRPDGEIKIVHERGKTFYDDSGKPLNSIGTVQDITEQQKAEEEIRKLNTELEHRVEQRTKELQKLSLAVEQSASAVVITNKKGMIEYVNPKFCEITGYDENELIGKNPRILKGGDRPASFYKDLWDTLLTGNEWHGEFCNKRKTGEIFWESASISPIRDSDGTITHFVAVKEDITKQKQISDELQKAKEYAESASNAKGQFLANMSHEIRTPLNAITGMTHLLQRAQLSDTQSDYVEKIQTASNNLLGIVNDILDYSKIEAGMIEFESTSFNLDDVFQNLTAVTSVAAKKKRIELVYNIDPRLPRSLIGDPLRLGQVLINLTNNAIKFTEDGEVVVSAEFIKKTKDETTIQFSVSDTGLGMTEEQMANIFSAFTQADSSTTRKFGGSGLGLTISKKIVDMMGGQLQVKSKSGKGSTFSFWLNFDVPETQPDSSKPNRRLKSMRILVVDDNESTLDVLRKTLETYSFSPVCVKSGEEALNVLQGEVDSKNKPFGLIILDWILPGLDGIETLRRIQEVPTISPKPPAILLTGFGDETVSREAAHAGIRLVLQKPFKPSTLFNAIIDVLSEKTKQRTGDYPLPTDTLEDIKKISGSKILLVEDNTVNQQVTTELLDQEGFIVKVAENGEEACRLVNRHRDDYDLVLMDLQMPVMDGYEATRKIRRMEIERNQKDTLPILALTADVVGKVQEQCFEAGMNDFIAKPVDPQDLYLKLIKWIPPKKTIMNTDSEDNMSDWITGPSKFADRLNLEGIDTEAGLERIGGKSEVYTQLLRKFVTNQTDAVKKIRSAVKANDLDSAQRLAHTLMGVSGNIGAMELHAASKTLTEALKKGEDSNYEPLLQGTERQLNRVIESIRSLGEDDEPHSKEALSSEQLTQKLLQLRESLSTNDTNSLKLFDEVKNALMKTAHNGEVEKIAASLERYDFDTALKQYTRVYQGMNEKKQKRKHVQESPS